MANPYPANVSDESGEVRISGEIDFTDPANQPGSFQSGAGSPVGAVVPTGIGSPYIDTSVGALWQANGVTNADWVFLGGIMGSNKYGIQLLTAGPGRFWRVNDTNNGDGLIVSDSAALGRDHAAVSTAFNLLDDGTTLGGADFFSGVGFWQTNAPLTQPSITGALSAVTDANAKAVLTAIVAALSGCGLAHNGTT